MFRTTEKRRRDEPGIDQDPVEMPPTQIGRALQELGITWIGAHSPQAKAYASHCTSFAHCRTTPLTGARLENFKPWAFRGGFAPGCSYKQSFLPL